MDSRVISFGGSMMMVCELVTTFNTFCIFPDMINNDQSHQSSTPVSTHVIAIFILVGVLTVLLVAIGLTMRTRSRRNTHGVYANLTKEDNESKLLLLYYNFVLALQ
jgi:hypothetical protein